MKFHDLNEDIERVIVNEKELDAITTRIAAEIDRDQAGSNNDLILLCVLKGSISFMSALMQKIKTPMEIDFMKASSYYGGIKSTGNISIQLDINRQTFQNCDIIVVEDIVDSGRTLSRLMEYLHTKGADSVRTVTMLDKPMCRQVPFEPDYVGVTIPDEFVVGFGLDYEEHYRELPYVGVLKREIYEKKIAPGKE